ncbi:hypothetical protein GTID1_08665 [Geobacillus thermodenitrificans]|uniref:helix-turn-helix domain-containing protein n=2 Tax=Geobacillus TaxID=129337 RepID=UPI0006E6AF56|nr:MULTISPECIES: helix-turn-helix transcriptional regulator [Geobacillus]ATO37287.1 hypothetical protein GTID1_08665 [Geobacillus thermodenitrificans]KQB94797.1 hypothetical protein GEPA3_0243 [Geobacillus sp. PA-3]
MTLGEKIKKARIEAGLSQEQLSEKLGVSRSAVAKWESGKGLPDIDNLKNLSKLLNASIDYLLDDGETLDEMVMREPYNLSEYGKGLKSSKKNRVIRDKFPNAEIYSLLAYQKLTKGEKIVDNALGFFTDAPFGMPEFLNYLKNNDKRFYLVEKDGKQFFVTVTDEFIETRQLANRIDSKKFEIGNWKFKKTGKI